MVERHPTSASGPLPEWLPFADGVYRVAPDLRPLGRPGPGHVQGVRHFDDPGQPEVLAQKLALLRAHRTDVVVTAEGADGPALNQVWWAMARQLADEHPAWVTLADDALVVPAWALALTADGQTVRGPAPEAPPLAHAVADHLRALPAGERLGELVALLVAEDHVVIHESDGDARMEHLHVVFPSAWDPVEKVGRSFAEVHAPVVHNTALVAAGPELMRTVVRRGPFVRWTWGVHRDGALCHHPRLHQQPAEPVQPTPAQAAAASWIRLERQTFLPMPALRRAVFTIRVYVAPLDALVARPGACAALADALASMSPEALIYKGLVQRRDPLVKWLRAQDQGSGATV